jgi:hypothetical protein
MSIHNNAIALQRNSSLWDEMHGKLILSPGENVSQVAGMILAAEARRNANRAALTDPTLGQ